MQEAIRMVCLPWVMPEVAGGMRNVGTVVWMTCLRIIIMLAIQETMAEEGVAALAGPNQRPTGGAGQPARPRLLKQALFMA